MGVKVREKITGSGVWWVFVNHNGLRRSKKAGTEKLANKVKEVMEAKLKLGQPLFAEKEKPPLPTLNQYYERFEATYMQTAITGTTFISYEKNFRVHILPALGKYRLA